LKRVLAFLARELGPDRPGTLPKGRKLGA